MMKQFSFDSFLLGVCFALLVAFLIYFVVKSVKQEKYIRHLEQTLENIHKEWEKAKSLQGIVEYIESELLGSNDKNKEN